MTATAAPTTPRRRVLMLAYYFPPVGGGGVQRTAKYAKYLPAHGFDAAVVAGSKRAFPLRDHELCRDVPQGTPVRRARVLPLHEIQWKVDGLFRRLGLPTRLINEALWPDESVGWLPAAILQSLRMIKTFTPDVIYTTSFPATAHLAGLIVHRATGLPWVADFRDSYTLNPLHTKVTSYSLVARASVALERAVVRHASYITFADETMNIQGLTTHDVRRVVIPNGVDPDDLPPPSKGFGPGTTPFRISYVGSLYGHHDGGPFFAALRELIRQGRLSPDDFEVRIVGHASLKFATDLDSLPITFTGYVSHREALEEMFMTSALLYSRPPGDPVASGKIFEYLCSERPVLCVADPASLAYQLIETLGGGRCVSVGDPAAIGEAFLQMLTDWRAGTLSVDPQARNVVLERFSRDVLSARLADVLRAAIANDDSQSPCHELPADRLSVV